MTDPAKLFLSNVFLQLWVKISLPHSSVEVFTFNPIRLSESRGHFFSYDQSRTTWWVRRRVMRMTSRSTKSLAAWSWLLSREACWLSSCGFLPNFAIKLLVAEAAPRKAQSVAHHCWLVTDQCGQHHANDKLLVVVWAKPLSCHLNQIAIDESTLGREMWRNRHPVYVYWFPTLITEEAGTETIG